MIIELVFSLPKILYLSDMFLVKYTILFIQYSDLMKVLLKIQIIFEAWRIIKKDWILNIVINSIRLGSIYLEELFFFFLFFVVRTQHEMYSINFWVHNTVSIMVGTMLNRFLELIHLTYWNIILLKINFTFFSTLSLWQPWSSFPFLSWTILHIFYK